MLSGIASFHVCSLRLLGALDPEDGAAVRCLCRVARDAATPYRRAMAFALTRPRSITSTLSLESWSLIWDACSAQAKAEGMQPDILAHALDYIELDEKAPPVAAMPLLQLTWKLVQTSAFAWKLRLFWKPPPLESQGLLPPPPVSLPPSSFQRPEEHLVACPSSLSTENMPGNECLSLWQTL